MITPHPQLIDEIVGIGVAKTHASVGRVAMLAIMAGAFIALGGMLSVAVGFGFPEISTGNPGLQKLLSGLLFPVGLLLVVMFGAELFTGNNAVLMPGLSAGKFGPVDVLRQWFVVWIFNFVGALAFTWLFVDFSGLTSSEPYHSAIIGIATAKANLPFMVAFVKGIAANWCVCLAVWLALMVKTLPAKVLACWIPVGAFVILGYEHSIANMYYLMVGIFSNSIYGVGNTAVNLGAALTKNLLPVTLGNLIGGAAIGIVYWYLYLKGTKKD